MKTTDLRRLASTRRRPRHGMALEQWRNFFRRKQAKDLKAQVERAPIVAAMHADVADKIDAKYLSSHARAMRGLKKVMEARA